MTRALSANMVSEITKDGLTPLVFLELDFSGGFVRVHNGRGTITWDGKSWVGTGHLLAVSAVEEATTLEATSMSFTLSGVPSALIASVYGEFSQGRPARVWFACYDFNTGGIITDPVQVFGGRMDTIGDDDDGQTSTIVIQAESHLADLGRPRKRTYTNQDQQRLFPADKSLRFVTGLQDKPVYWGTSRPRGGPGAGEA